MNKNPFVKLIVVVLLAILGLWLIQAVLYGTGFGFGVGFRGNYGGAHMYMGTGYGYGGSSAYLLMLMIKVLFVVFIVALAAGVILWIKSNLFTSEDVAIIKNSFSGNRNLISKETCSICGKELNAEWKVCPHCGKEKEAKDA